MSTNYYARHNICTCCNRYDQLHIGLRSGGWRFIFQSLPDRKLTSFAAWREFLDSPGTLIFDEYNSQITPGAFASIVQFDRDGDNHHLKHPTKTTFVDDHGWPFDSADFS